MKKKSVFKKNITEKEVSETINKLSAIADNTEIHDDVITISVPVSSSTIKFLTMGKLLGELLGVSEQEIYRTIVSTGVDSLFKMLWISFMATFLGSQNTQDQNTVDSNDITKKLMKLTSH